MAPRFEQAKTRTCECCGGIVGEYKATFCFEVWKEVVLEAPNDDAAGRAFADMADNMEMAVPEGWNYGSLQVYDNAGDPYYER